jgi:hypothetical protein
MSGMQPGVAALSRHNRSVIIRGIGQRERTAWPPAPVPRNATII